jgi:hypothetical protein
MWKNLSADTKESYYTASRQADEEHKRKYPGYYYSPKEARMNKMHKHNLALARKGSKPVDAMHLVKVSLCCYYYIIFQHPVVLKFHLYSFFSIYDATQFYVRCC